MLSLAALKKEVTEQSKSFLVLFFKKELLSSLRHCRQHACREVCLFGEAVHFVQTRGNGSIERKNPCVRSDDSPTLRVRQRDSGAHEHAVDFDNPAILHLLS
jgi:hypothetical protein